jgi:hypothetical protein
VERLNTGLDKKLTLIAAPAGFGKTTLVVDWIKQIDLPAAWLSLNEADNNLPRFLIYLAAALQQVDDIYRTIQPDPGRSKFPADRGAGYLEGQHPYRIQPSGRSRTGINGRARFDPLDWGV